MNGYCTESAIFLETEIVSAQEVLNPMVWILAACSTVRAAITRFGILALVVFLFEKWEIEMSIVYSIFKVFVVFLT